MGNFTSPADPIFWSHHAMVDLLHVTFHKCRVGTERLTFAQKASHPVAWTSCARRNSTVTFRPTDEVTMRTGERGMNPIAASTDPLIGRFFTGIPNQFAGLMDTRDLGSSSYEYYISGQVATMYTQCDASPTSRKLEETHSKSIPTMCGVPDSDGYDENGNDYASLNNYPETDHHDKHQDAVIVDSTGRPIHEHASRDAYVSEESEKKVVDWHEQTLAALGGDSQENMDDLERQACMFEHICLGGTKDYSPEFKALWKVTEPRCKTIVDAVLNRDETIKYESWRETMELAFGCPEPSYTNDTSAYSGGSWGSSASGSLSSTITNDVDTSNDTNHLTDMLDNAEVGTSVMEDPEPTTEVVEISPATNVLEDRSISSTRKN
ncbi:Common central domain of tyrosinase [Phytophthora infestans]|nr:Common central domain of tyrosinase [Phytophthora infestans]